MCVVGRGVEAQITVPPVHGLHAARCLETLEGRIDRRVAVDRLAVLFGAGCKRRDIVAELGQIAGHGQVDDRRLITDIGLETIAPFHTKRFVTHLVGLRGHVDAITEQFLRRGRAFAMDEVGTDAEPVAGLP